MRGRPSASPASLVKQGRHQLLDDISALLLDNDLEITPANLAIMHAACSGANPRLARQMTARAVSGEAITQQWLDEIGGSDAEKQKGNEIETLVTRLESHLEAFAKSARAAHVASATYGADLAQHVTELEQVKDTGQIVIDLADLAKTMLERTRKVEGDMRRSEEEARSLRKSLEKATRDAERDHLTGLPNRRSFEALLERQYREAKAEMESLTVAFCDIDHFKRVNDMHGHDTGDRVIKAVGETLSRITNDNCHVARHGGEEFVMLFRGITPAEAKQRLDETRERMAGRSFVNRKTEEPIGQVTFSGGVADVFRFEDARAALAAADEALYRAKEAGRNCIMLA